MSGEERSVEPSGSGAREHSGKVAEHYNTLQEKGLAERGKSRIFYMRNFNNWTKACVITEFLNKIKKMKSSSSPLCVLDLCCGKGGDLLKWRQGQIDKLVCADIAAVSVEQCEKRYNDMTHRGRKERFPPKQFSAQFITADCTKVRLKDEYEDPEIQFDLCSCQFSFHYSFESYQQADMMLRNATECLCPGGYFILSIPNSYELVKRLEMAPGLEFGNDVYKINFQSKTYFPLFGCKYDFKLHEVVDCPEFLVYLPALEEMAKKYDMEIVFVRSFPGFFEDYQKKGELRGLLGRMQALEPFPPECYQGLMSSQKEDYEHAQVVSDDRFGKDADGNNIKWSERLGTLSAAEWEAISIYNMVAFKKSKNLQ